MMMMMTVVVVVGCFFEFNIINVAADE